MPNRIVIDFTNIDIKSFHDTEKILHKSSYDEVIALLQEDLEVKIEDSKDFEDFYRTHNAIFIEGGRGSGKTQFLLNLKHSKKSQHNQDNEVVKKLYFIGPIDPTILHDNESFLTIVLARILNQIEQDLKNINEHQKKEFYELLKSISFAIDGVIHKKNNHKTALEHIAQDQSSLKLERYLHDFFSKISKIVGDKKLVLLIDDIDMAFDKGFEILEVIRKYLSSPYLVPILTGDKMLYEDILEKHFFHELSNDYFESKYYKKDLFDTSYYKKDLFDTSYYKKDSLDTSYYKRDTIAELQKDYLTKVLPQHRRVKLETLFELGLKHKIIFKYNQKEFSFQFNETNGFFYRRGEDIFKSYTLRDKFIEKLFSNSLRKIIQFLHKEYQSNNDETKQFNLINRDTLKILEANYGLKLIPIYQEIDKDLFDRGKEELSKGEIGHALEYFKRSYALNPIVETLYQIGNCYFASGNYTKSKETFRKVIKLDVDNANAYYKLAYIYAFLERYELAIENYNKVLEILPNNANTYNSLGLSYIALGHYSEAFDSYQKALELKDNYYKPYINIFEIALVSKKFYEEHQKRVDKLKIEFKEKFEQDEIAFKSFDMLNILYNIFYKSSNKKSIEQLYNKWQQKYKEITIGDWNFTAIDNWIEKMRESQKKSLLLEYIEKFKEVM